ncbi:MAG: hypothetical protein R2762_14630 [Bryobacteraceae bacterium]
MGKHRANKSILPLEPGDWERIMPKSTADPRDGCPPEAVSPALERHDSIGEVG